MIQNRKIIAVIPARGGSKGIKRKNLRKLGGQSLIERSFVEAKKSKFIDSFILSSEDEEMLEHGKQIGMECLKRPLHLASDTAGSFEVAEHVLTERPGFDLLVLLQTTSPFRTVEDIDFCIELSQSLNASSVVSMVAMRQSPHFAYREVGNAKVEKLIPEKNTGKRRQDLPKFLVPNGAVYVERIPDFLSEKTFYCNDLRAYEMPEERSLDLDNEIDLNFAEYLLSGR